MPGFITHLSFGEQSLSFIESENTRDFLENNINVFGLGLQGPDIFFYHLPAYICYKKNIGNIMHRSRVMLFFDSLFSYRNSFETIEEKNICDAYILGFIGHYTLDVACHPYIYYRSDHFENLKKSTKYDFGRHISLETDIDHVVLDHYKHLLPSQFNYAGAVIVPIKALNVIAKLLYLSIKRTYPENKVRQGTIIGAINSFVKLNFAMHDPSGIKKKRLRKIEQHIFKHAYISSMIPSDTKIKYSDPCNLYHNEWHNPWDPDIPRTDSIFDMINKAMPDYIRRITQYVKSTDMFYYEDEADPMAQTNKYLHERNILLADLSDISYLTGLPIED